MKLTLIGAGVRSPLFAAAALRRATAIGLDELWLLDIQPERIRIFGDLASELARQFAPSVAVHSTTDATDALRDVGQVVIAIRVGGEEGRILDERIALRHGVLGQETTGPGGFAMAMRSIPAVLDYAERIDALSRGAWIHSFTNPAGLVTQALRDAGFARTVGICDGANTAQRAVAAYCDVPYRELRSDVFGLNHLSWTRRVSHEGRDLLGAVLTDTAFRVASHQDTFDPSLVAHLGMFLNDYLYYYYYAEQAVERIEDEGRTRGEEIRDLTAELLPRLAAATPEEGLGILGAYHARRTATYMHYARTSAPTMSNADEQRYATVWDERRGEGYTGVALDTIEALVTGTPAFIALNVPNEGAIEGFRATDVVEVSCRVDADGVHPLPIGAIPEHCALLMNAVKSYERWAVVAVREQSPSLAVQALMAHPLVLSYSRASALVSEYLEAHAAFTGWPGLDA